MVIPASKGKFHVYLECDGQMAVKSVGGKADNTWRGLIAYDTSRRMWNVGNYKGCVIENYKMNSTFVNGHPDVELNDCKFDKARGVEADWYASFQLTCDDDEGSWLLYAPPIPKDSLYNYTVSYGEYTENMCEWGAVSISIDEDNGSTGNEVSNYCRRGYMRQSLPEGKLEQQPYVEDVDKINSWKENQSETSSDSEDVAFANKMRGKLPNQTKLPPKGFLSRLKPSEKEEIVQAKPTQVTDDDVLRGMKAVGVYANPSYVHPVREKLEDIERQELMKELEKDLQEINRLEPPDEISAEENIPDFVEPVLPVPDPDWFNEHTARTISVMEHPWDLPPIEDTSKKKLRGTLSQVGGSISGKSSLGGGTLRRSTEDVWRETMKSKLSTSDRNRYERILKGQGKTVADQFLRDRAA